jgi:hypothetical protein
MAGPPPKAICGIVIGCVIAIIVNFKGVGPGYDFSAHYEMLLDGLLLSFIYIVYLTLEESIQKICNSSSRPARHQAFDNNLISLFTVDKDKDKDLTKPSSPTENSSSTSSTSTNSDSKNKPLQGASYLLLPLLYLTESAAKPPGVILSFSPFVPTTDLFINNLIIVFRITFEIGFLLALYFLLQSLIGILLFIYMKLPPTLKSFFEKKKNEMQCIHPFWYKCINGLYLIIYFSITKFYFLRFFYL